MVTRRRLRAFLTALGYYVCAALFVGYFAVNAYTGDRGLKAKQDIEVQIGELSAELDELKRTRELWEKQLALLRAGSLDPDLLDERARVLLGYAHPHDLVIIVPGQ
jgi:cell division protein FtsB